MSISTADSIEGDFTTADKMKANNTADVDKKIDKASKEAKADGKMDYENVKGVKVSGKKDDKDGNEASADKVESPIKGEKSKAESAAVKSVNDDKFSELAAIVSSRGYSRVSHTIRSRTDCNKVIGYALLLDDEVMDDLEEFYLIPVTDIKAGKAGRMLLRILCLTLM